MPAKRKAMRKIKEVLRLKFEADLSHERIAAALGLSKGAVTKYVQRAVAAGLGWPLAPELDDTALETLLFPDSSARAVTYAPPDFALIHLELKRKGVTLQLLWEEYSAAHADGAYRYSQFCLHYHRFRPEHVLAVRNRREHIRLDPISVEQHAFLVTARVEVARLAGVREQVVVPAGVAVDAGKTIVRVAALDEALDHPSLDRAPRASGGVQLFGMALRALPQSARAWPARAILPGACRRGGARGSRPLSLRAARLHPGANAPAAQRTRSTAAKTLQARQRQRAGTAGVDPRLLPLGCEIACMAARLPPPRLRPRGSGPSSRGASVKPNAPSTSISYASPRMGTLRTTARRSTPGATST